MSMKEKFGTHNFLLHDWPEYNGRWMTSKEGRAADVPLRKMTYNEMICVITTSNSICNNTNTNDKHKTQA